MKITVSLWKKITVPVPVFTSKKITVPVPVFFSSVFFSIGFPNTADPTHHRPSPRHPQPVDRPGSLRWPGLTTALFLSFLASTALATTQTATAPTANALVSVMPLGDSITAGSAGGYRKPLAQELEADHYTITTVGSQIDHSLPLGHQNHEAHPGWRIDQLADNLLGLNPLDTTANGGYWLTGGHNTGRGPIHPTFITLMAGINDINQTIGSDPAHPMSARSEQIMATLQQRMQSLVNTLTQNLPQSTLLLGGCIPYNNGLLDEKLTGATRSNRTAWAAQDGATPMQEMGVNHWVLLFNHWLKNTCVPQLQSQGKKVYYVNVYSQFILPDGAVRSWDNKEPQNTDGPAAYADYGLHPNTFGYRLMAHVWAAAIHEHLKK